ncbi:hypothetical protein [Glutamicibacter sp.]|uniref:hypothetical protein n=1 Tax=Glutamicibacter sp. TaxID=1931995 RepID=UPI0028BDBEC4|nr:hypothetical protein [Glutamicibacter sp.]
MSRQRNVNDGNVADILRRIRRLEKSSNMNHSAIGREGLEVYDGGWIRILNGGLQVIGTATISGVLDVTGTFNASGDNNMTGTNNLSGTNHLTGPTDVAGDFDIIAGGIFRAGESWILPDGSADFGDLHIAPDGALSAGEFHLFPDGSADFGTLGIEADGTLNVHNDVNILEGGKINVGNLQIEPANGGQINFLNGALTSMPEFGMMLNHTNNIDLQAPVLNLNVTTIHTSLPSKPEAELTPIGVDASGNLYKIS